MSGWCAAVAAAAGLVALRRARTRHRGDSDASIAELRSTVVEGLALAIVWAVPPLAFYDSATPDPGLWLVTSVLMTAAAITAAPLALATCTFIVALGGAVAVRLAIAGDYPATAAVIAITALLCAGCITRARALVTIRQSQLALEERDETVSLLLREFEDDGADWLWETDAARRVVRANSRFAHACGLDLLAINGMPFLQVLAGPSWESRRFRPRPARARRQAQGARELPRPAPAGDGQWRGALVGDCGQPAL